MKKNVLKAIIFLIILLFMLFILQRFFSNKKAINNSSISIIGLTGEKINSLDYLVLGDSEAYNSVIPLEIWHKYGYAGYVVGSAGQTLDTTKENLINSLQNQHPKLVVLDTNLIFRKEKKVKLWNKLDSFLISLFKNHDNWKFLLFNNYNDYSGSEKGYSLTTKIKTSHGLTKVNKNLSNRISTNNIEYLKEIKKICEENNIKLLLISTPSTKNWNMTKHNNLVNLSKRLKIDFIDLNLDNKININWKKDTQDVGDHLNYFGALKNTNRLGQILKQTNLLTDHRSDNYYSSWNIWYEKYKTKFNNE